ncbi:MAG: zinc ribbon domain-containing protein [Methanobrevibacter sp.]|nr:zinc ribbon domain-containing protein [Methanobrevibacter sp.]
MKCSQCGFENNEKAKFCTKCGSSLTQTIAEPASKSNNNLKYVIIALVVIIIVLVGCIGFFVMNTAVNNDISQDSAEDNDVEQDDSVSTQEVSSSQSPKTSQVTQSKSWVLIGSYSGSGSGSEVINVPEGTIKVELSAYPIKNYATNYLYVTGSNGKSGGVDWGSTSAVETRSDSFTYTSSSSQTFTIDYYETVSWQVDFYIYQ